MKRLFETTSDQNNQKIWILSVGTWSIPSSKSSNIRKLRKSPVAEKKCQISWWSYILPKMHSLLRFLDWAGATPGALFFILKKYIPGIQHTTQYDEKSETSSISKVYVFFTVKISPHFCAKNFKNWWRFFVRFQKLVSYPSIKFEIIELHSRQIVLKFSYLSSNIS